MTWKLSWSHEFDKKRDIELNDIHSSEPRETFQGDGNAQKQFQLWVLNVQMSPRAPRHVCFSMREGSRVQHRSKGIDEWSTETLAIKHRQHIISKHNLTSPWVMQDAGNRHTMSNDWAWIPSRTLTYKPYFDPCLFPILVSVFESGMEPRIYWKSGNKHNIIYSWSCPRTGLSTRGTLREPQNEGNMQT